MATRVTYITCPSMNACGQTTLKFWLSPPHTSHLLQPLDSAPFASFKIAWERHLRRYNSEHHGRPLNKVNFWDVFVPAWNSSMTTKNIMAGFRKTGVSPFNLGAISVAAMGPSSVTDNGKHWFCSNVGVFCVVCRLKCSFHSTCASHFIYNYF